jgi:hypothetical protein
MNQFEFFKQDKKNKKKKSKDDLIDKSLKLVGGVMLVGTALAVTNKMLK